MFAVIGDIVGSRVLPDRAAAQARVADVLGEVRALLPGPQPLEVTVGDEFQGAWDSSAEAVRAALLVRLWLRPHVDVRCGIGHGAATVFDDSRRPLLQDGPAWWAAREALATMTAPRRTATRTWLVAETGAEAVNAHLLTRDALVDRLSDRGCRMLRLALLGASQQRIAELEGVSKSAVSQQFARGIGAVRDAEALLWPLASDPFRPYDEKRGRT